jgi:pantothenate synthetase
MKTLPLLNYLPYSSETHKEYYRKMPKVMAKYEAVLENMGAEIEFEPEEEDITPEDTLYEKESANRVRKDYNNGNIYAWFCAKVTVKYKEFEETDYLGACSYKDEKDFKRGGYYYDMVTTCVQEINKQIEDYNADIQKRWNIRKAKYLIAPYGLHIVASLQIAEVA